MLASNITPATITAVTSDVNKETGLQLVAVNENSLIEQLSNHIDYLINHQFEQLIYLLYRIDIPEDAIKELLQLHAVNDAATLIATAIIHRQIQKVQQRKTVTNYHASSTEEKW